MYVGATNKKILEDKIGFQKLTEDFDDLSYIAEKVFINPVLGTSEVTFVTTGPLIFSPFSFSCFL